MNKISLKNHLYLFIVLTIVNSCTPINSYFGLSDDNLIEESIELYLENEMGLDIDLSPETPE